MDRARGAPRHDPRRPPGSIDVACWPEVATGEVATPDRERTASALPLLGRPVQGRLRTSRPSRVVRLAALLVVACMALLTACANSEEQAGPATTTARHEEASTPTSAAMPPPPPAPPVGQIATEPFESDGATYIVTGSGNLPASTSDMALHEQVDDRWEQRFSDTFHFPLIPEGGESKPFDLRDVTGDGSPDVVVSLAGATTVWGAVLTEVAGPWRLADFDNGPARTSTTMPSLFLDGTFWAWSLADWAAEGTGERQRLQTEDGITLGSSKDDLRAAFDNEVSFFYDPLSDSQAFQVGEIGAPYSLSGTTVTDTITSFGSNDGRACSWD